MERRTVTLFVLGASLWVLLGATGESSTATQDEPSASEGWVRAPGAGEANAKAFVLISNPSMYDVYIVSASAEIAKNVEFRNASSGETKTIREITVPAYGSLAMGPDAIHLELVDVSRTLELEETFPITLKTDGGVELAVQAVVKDE